EFRILDGEASRVLKIFNVGERNCRLANDRDGLAVAIVACGVERLDVVHGGDISRDKKDIVAYAGGERVAGARVPVHHRLGLGTEVIERSEEHTSEFQSL